MSVAGSTKGSNKGSTKGSTKGSMKGSKDNLDELGKDAPPTDGEPTAPNPMQKTGPKLAVRVPRNKKTTSNWDRFDQNKPTDFQVK